MTTTIRSRCAQCLIFYNQPNTGRRRIYHSDACRQQACRQRKASRPEEIAAETENVVTSTLTSHPQSVVPELTREEIRIMVAEEEAEEEYQKKIKWSPFDDDDYISSDAVIDD